ncbi:hypothetical protein O6H91_07G087900 [Diphasiastrum complanatum]|uniref:Uncharacterized protein n=1 Tax=Diphasiastrum complanatum TaxID=34168 RepID=A0ACC2D7L5_DIPCM|nr:hypothetical protein O6H91_07G087900 [Diphasiastrum complanatum]
MGSLQNQKWMSFFADNMLDEEGQPGNAFLWYPQPPTELADCSGDNECSRGELDEQGRFRIRKRSRDESHSGGGSKACREKMRRDRLNDRFLELSTILDPSRPPKTDKVTILSAAIRVLNQLRAEAQQLKDSNDQLREAIKELKVGKSELRDEKFSLKSEKEKLEHQIKCMTMTPGLIPHSALFHAAAASFTAQTQACSTKSASSPGYPGIPMWQWLPAAAVDTSQDHVLRPPVA